MEKDIEKLQAEIVNLQEERNGLLQKRVEEIGDSFGDSLDVFLYGTDLNKLYGSYIAKLCAIVSDTTRIDGSLRELCQSAKEAYQMENDFS